MVSWTWCMACVWKWFIHRWKWRKSVLFLSHPVCVSVFFPLRGKVVEEIQLDGSINCNVICAWIGCRIPQVLPLASYVWTWPDWPYSSVSRRLSPFYSRTRSVLDFRATKTPLQTCTISKPSIWRNVHQEKVDLSPPEHGAGYPRNQRGSSQRSQTEVWRRLLQEQKVRLYQMAALRRWKMRLLSEQQGRKGELVLWPCFGTLRGSKWD